jgi:hypothetical protein
MLAILCPAARDSDARCVAADAMDDHSGFDDVKPSAANVRSACRLPSFILSRMCLT